MKQVYLILLRGAIKLNNNSNINEKGYIYGKWMTKDNTYTISFGGAVYCYLLIGEEKAMLIDTAYGEGNLREYVEQITDKPVMVVNTHGHFDHTGGNAQWEEAYLSEASSKDCKIAFTQDMYEKMKEKSYPDYKVNIVSEGYKFDLGGRTVEVIDIPAHHEGSIALLDSGSKFLFTGDELEAGQVLIFGDDVLSRIRKHKENMEKLKKRSDEFEALCPAHNGNPINKKYIDDYIILDKLILECKHRVLPNTAGFGFPPDASSFPPVNGKAAVRTQFGNASICYTLD